MDLQLQGKVALVTGSTAGIGKAIAAGLAGEGARVIINGRDVDRTANVARELGARGEVHGVAADASTAQGVDALMRGAERVGPIDILVNNVGDFAPTPFEAISDEEWERLFQANVMSGVRASRAVMGGMRERGWGRILFISSEAGINASGDRLHYSATKAAQLAVSRGLAVALQGTGVTVNSVVPGPTWTESMDTFMGELAQATNTSIEQLQIQTIRQYWPTSLLGRFATPEEIASVVIFLASPLASAITGTAQKVEGGIVNTCF